MCNLFAPDRTSTHGTSRSSLFQPAGSSAWDLFLGPTEQENPHTAADSPAFKLPYARPQLVSDCPTKRKLNHGWKKNIMSATYWTGEGKDLHKVRVTHVLLIQPQTPSPKQNKSPPLGLFLPKLSAPFFAAAINVGCRVSHSLSH